MIEINDYEIAVLNRITTDLKNTCEHFGISYEHYVKTGLFKKNRQTTVFYNSDKHCKCCNKRIITGRKTKRFCNDKCKNAYNNKRRKNE